MLGAQGNVAGESRGRIVLGYVAVFVGSQISGRTRGAAVKERTRQQRPREGEGAKRAQGQRPRDVSMLAEGVGRQLLKLSNRTRLALNLELVQHYSTSAPPALAVHQHWEIRPPLDNVTNDPIARVAQTMSNRTGRWKLSPGVCSEASNAPASASYCARVPPRLSSELGHRGTFHATPHFATANHALLRCVVS